MGLFAALRGSRKATGTKKKKKGNDEFEFSVHDAAEEAFELHRPLGSTSSTSRSSRSKHNQTFSHFELDDPEIIALRESTGSAVSPRNSWLGLRSKSSSKRDHHRSPMPSNLRGSNVNGAPYKLRASGSENPRYNSATMKSQHAVAKTKDDDEKDGAHARNRASIKKLKSAKSSAQLKQLKSAKSNANLKQLKQAKSSRNMRAQLGTSEEIMNGLSVRPQSVSFDIEAMKRTLSVKLGGNFLAGLRANKFRDDLNDDDFQLSIPAPKYGQAKRESSVYLRQDNPTEIPEYVDVEKTRNEMFNPDSYDPYDYEDGGDNFDDFEPDFTYSPPLSVNLLPEPGTKEYDIYLKKIEEEEIFLENAKRGDDYNASEDLFPATLGNGCYLRLDPNGSLVAKWSLEPVEDAIAFFFARKSIPKHYYETNLGVVELVRGVQSKNIKKRFFSGWIAFLRNAYEVDGVLKILREEQGEFYYMPADEKVGKNRVMKMFPNQWFEMRNAIVFAVLPLNKCVFKGIKFCSLSNFEDLANTSDGGSWKPLNHQIKKATMIEMPIKRVNTQGTETSKTTAIKPATRSAQLSLNAKLKENREILKGCYLRADLTKQTLTAVWSEQFVDDAVAFFQPKKKVSASKYQQGINVVELAKGLVKLQKESTLSRKGRIVETLKKDKNYFSGWINYLKLAHNTHGIVEIFSKQEGDMYYMDFENSIHKVSPLKTELKTSKVRVFALLPLKSEKLQKGLTAEELEDLVKKSDSGCIWKPLGNKKFGPVRSSTIQRKKKAKNKSTSSNKNIEKAAAPEPAAVATVSKSAKHKHIETKAEEKKKNTKKMNSNVKNEPAANDQLDPAADVNVNLETEEEKGCYLKIDPAKSALTAIWSEKPVNGAIAFFFPRKLVQPHKYKPGQNVVELVRGLNSNRKDKTYISGWMHYLKIAYELDGVLKIFSKTEGEFYYMDSLNRVRQIKPKEWFETNESCIFSLLPLRKNIFAGVKTSSISNFETVSSSVNGGTWKPMKKQIKNMVTVPPSELNTIQESLGIIKENVTEEADNDGITDELIVSEVVDVDQADKNTDITANEAGLERSHNNDMSDLGDGKGCYLKIDKDKSTLVGIWSENVVKDAIAFFYPRKPVAAHKYKAGFNTIELVRGLKSNRKGSDYFSGWLHYIKIAYEVDGVLKILSNTEAEFYYMDEENTIFRISPNEWLETHQSSVFAVLPFQKEIFKGVKKSTMSNFEDLVNTNNGGTWKPLKQYKRVMLVRRKSALPTPDELPANIKTDMKIKKKKGKNSKNDERKKTHTKDSKLVNQKGMNAETENLPKVEEEHFDLFTGKGCYLTLKSGTMRAQWSEVPVSGAICFFYPQKPVPKHKYQSSNVIELAPGAVIQNKKDPNYFSGWAHYLKCAYEVEGVMKMLTREDCDLFYINDLNCIYKIEPNTWFETNKIRAFGVVPQNKKEFKGILSCTVSRFEDMSAQAGGSTWKPLKLYKRI